MPRLRWVAAVLAVAGYAVASHWLMSDMPERPWTVALVLGPMLLALLAWSWQRRGSAGWGGFVACAGATTALGVVVARGGVTDLHRLYVLQHAGIHVALGWAFASSLRAGATPTITALAAQVHERLTPEMQAYTRRLTAVWVGYFFGMAALSLLLYALAPWAWWSLLANLATPVAIGVLLVGEHLLRHVWHPEFERAPLAQSVQAWRRSSTAERTR